MRTCFCKSCQACKDLPKDCRLRKPSVLRLIDYANKTQEELHNSLKWRG